MGWFFHPLSGNGYQFWSGIGSDLSEVTLFGALMTAYYHHNCHVKGCLRWGKHKVDGSPYCSKHKEIK